MPRVLKRVRVTRRLSLTALLCDATSLSGATLQRATGRLRRRRQGVEEVVGSSDSTCVAAGMTRGVCAHVVSRLTGSRYVALLR